MDEAVATLGIAMRLAIAGALLGIAIFGCGPKPGSEEGAADFDKKREQAAKEMKEFTPPSQEEQDANKADGRM